MTVTQVNIMAGEAEFEWRGQTGLGLRAGQFQHGAGLQPQTILQLQPPSAVTSIALNTDWGVLAAGSAFGLAVFDMKCGQVVTARWFVQCAAASLLLHCRATVNSGLDTTEEGAAASNKSLRNSLRESFNRIR